MCIFLNTHLAKFHIYSICRKMLKVYFLKYTFLPYFFKYTFCKIPHILYMQKNVKSVFFKIHFFFVFKMHSKNRGETTFYECIHQNMNALNSFFHLVRGKVSFSSNMYFKKYILFCVFNLF
jgi:hypothetical protein